MNAFTTALQSHDQVTANGALSHSTSGNAVLDYFYKAGSYRGRSQDEVNKDMASIFGEDIALALRTVFYNRMITRKEQGIVNTEKVQRGQGQKDEFIKSLAWLEANRPELVYDNLKLIPVVGSWKDLWYDSPVSGFHHYVNPEKVYELVKRAMRNKTQRNLLAKYLPKLRSKRNRTNERHARLNKWVYGLIAYLRWTPAQYRKFKSNPENVAHLWQRQMAANEWEDINFKAVPGKALFQLVNNKGRKDKKSAIERHGLTDKYMQFLDSQPTAKFTGYVYELYKKAKGGRTFIQTNTLNKQFDHLIELAKTDVDANILKKGVLCALDTSGSMAIEVSKDVQAVDVCVGLGIFFSSFLQGEFKDTVVMFDSSSKILKLKGNFCEKVDQIKRQSIAWGSTNFESVITEIIRVRRTNPNIPVEDFPQVLLVVSDMQFNPTTGSVQTNYESAMRRLKEVGLPPMTIIWWQVNGSYGKDVPNKMDDEGVVLISGFDGSIVSTILGAKEVVNEKTGEVRKATPYEAMVQALNQEVLDLLIV